MYLYYIIIFIISVLLLFDVVMLIVMYRPSSTIQLQLQPVEKLRLHGQISPTGSRTAAEKREKL